ncbi:sugar phosphate isomerase/epimerase [Sphingobium sp.]|uniref:sugar phosphate isomerase/epimerase family protein n=1 Tax=Sphingobium sp. TaxID=1912891 RepID=UPI002B8F7EC7|nr:sugar phosphate isomerase/epimerase [Sphingobium sp.]HUD95585.1 sugar phosphate isomerase/epimerase [Sphingobium sp.]
MAANRSLSLDHITITDTTPWQLAEIAAATGCIGICPFLHSMAVLPAMPHYNLVTDPVARRMTRDALAADGLAVDLVYPFTMAGRTVVADFRPALEAAADLGAGLANILCYDRDPGRRIERLAELAELAGSYDIDLAIEFYPPSQVRTLAEALATIDVLGRTNAGVTLDLLHIVRGGDVAEAMALLADPRIRIAQISDGPSSIAPGLGEWEAGMERLLPGKGSIDIAAFLKAMRPGLPVSVEVPQQLAMDAGVSRLERARHAVDATRRFLV